MTKLAILRQELPGGGVSYEGPMPEREAMGLFNAARAAADEEEGGAVLPSIVREGDAAWPEAVAAVARQSQTPVPKVSNGG